MTISLERPVITQPYPDKCRLPFVLYPPAMWENTLGTEFASQNLDLTRVGDDFVIYISIPFCRVQCKACPYFVRTLGVNDASDIENRYIDALILDMQRWGSYTRFRDASLKAIYIGGGTGSILRTENIKRMVDALFENFSIAEDYSLTLEGNARDFTEDKLDYVANSPINRVSLGVQSFDAEVLRIVGSPHAAEASIETIQGLQKRGFRNIQLDMMYNMPGHTLDVWKSDLRMLDTLDIKHFTIYLYRIHEGTPQDQLIKKGEVPPVHDPESQYVNKMYSAAIEHAASMGYDMYMFDHFAKKDFENNYNYFGFREARDVLGLGAGSYSNVNNYRFGTDKDVDGYISAVELGEHMISAYSKRMTERNSKERYVMFTFQYFNVNFEAYHRHFGTDFLTDFGDIVDRLKRKGLVEAKSNQIVMTELGRQWRMNILLEFVDPSFWYDMNALEGPNWSMNVSMVNVIANTRNRWLGPLD